MVFSLLNSELTATNGTMLALGNVLVPPTTKPATMVSSDTSLSFFNEAILLANPVPDTLSKLLSTGGPFTLLAPVNDAFRLQGYNSPSDLDTLSPDSLRSLVLLSMIPQRIFSYDVVDSSTYVTAGDSTLLFTLTGIQPTIQILGNPNTSNVISGNAMALNGVLFKLDKLLEQ